MRENEIFVLLIILFPVAILFWNLFRYCTYVKISLPCGSFRVRRVFRYDMNVMARIVKKEFYGGGNIPPEVMKELYRKYGPLSWDTGRNYICNCWLGCLTWLKRCLFPNK